jgi:hypothetical protein
MPSVDWKNYEEFEEETSREIVKNRRNKVGKQKKTWKQVDEQNSKKKWKTKRRKRRGDKKH